MRYLHKLAAVSSAALFIAGSAVAQNAGTVTNHAFAIGGGPGVQGYTSLLCTSAQLAVGQAAADPICQTLTGDVTLSAAGVTTLATVNSNVGSFGSATQSAAVTVNAKGLITAASASTITPAIGSVTGLGTGCATFLATPSSANLRGCLTDEVGTGASYFIGGALGTPASATLTNATGLPVGGIASIGANTVIGNATGATTSPSAVTMPSCSGANQAVNWTSGTGPGCVTISGGGGTIEQMNPGGRLTLTSGAPVMAASQTAATTVYYAPYKGKYVPIYNGSAMQLYAFTATDTDVVGLTLTLGSNWTASSNYDAFAYVNGSSAGLCTGPDWSQGAVAGSNSVGSSSRGTGAGSTQLQMFKGFYTNQNSMTCRTSNAATVACAVNQCTYLGTFRTIGTAGQVSFTYGAQGTAGTFYVWNAFNQEYFCSTSNDPAAGTGIYNYTASTTRQANANSVNQFNFVTGAAGPSVDASYYVTPRSSALGAQYNFGLALNSTTTMDTASNQLFPGTANFNMTVTVSDAFKGVLGANFISANEAGDNTNSITVITVGSGNNLQRLKSCGFW